MYITDMKKLDSFSMKKHQMQAVSENSRDVNFYGFLLKIIRWLVQTLEVKKNI